MGVFSRCGFQLTNASAVLSRLSSVAKTIRVHLNGADWSRQIRAWQTSIADELEGALDSEEKDVLTTLRGTAVARSIALVLSALSFARVQASCSLGEGAWTAIAAHPNCAFSKTPEPLAEHNSAFPDTTLAVTFVRSQAPFDLHPLPESSGRARTSTAMSGTQLNTDGQKIGIHTVTWVNVQSKAVAAPLLGFRQVSLKPGQQSWGARPMPRFCLDLSRYCH
jgi:hypothetical protein